MGYPVLPPSFWQLIIMIPQEVQLFERLMYGASSLLQQLKDAPKPTKLKTPKKVKSIPLPAKVKAAKERRKIVLCRKRKIFKSWLPEMELFPIPEDSYSLHEYLP